MPRLQFDFTINLGHLVSALALLVGAGSSWMVMNARVSVLESSMVGVERSGSDIRSSVVEIDRKVTALLMQQRSRRTDLFNDQ